MEIRLRYGEKTLILDKDDAEKFGVDFSGNGLGNVSDVFRNEFGEEPDVARIEVVGVGDDGGEKKVEGWGL
jgi:hypothetical protein